MSDNLTLPVFPLPEVILFPRTMLPLHIYEARYQELIQDLLDKPEDERLVIITNMKYEGLPKGQNPFEKIGTVGKLVYIDHLEDGKSNIVLQGQFTVEMEEISPSPKPYRLASIIDIREEHWEDPLSNHSDAESRFMDSLENYMKRTNTKIKNLEDIELADLVNGLIRVLNIEVKEKQSILEIQKLDKRVDKLIEILDARGYYTEYVPEQQDYSHYN